MKQSQSYATRIVDLLYKAHLDLMKNPEAKKLEKVEAVLPNGLLAVIIGRIISDFTGAQLGLVDSYWECFDQLVNTASLIISQLLLTPDACIGDESRERTAAPL